MFGHNLADILEYFTEHFCRIFICNKYVPSAGAEKKKLLILVHMRTEYFGKSLQSFALYNFLRPRPKGAFYANLCLIIPAKIDSHPQSHPLNKFTRKYCDVALT